MAMSRLHYGVLAAALVLAAAALSACGSSNSNSADNSDITAAITKAATSGDPAACTTVQTAAFNAQTNGGNGDPTKACERNAAQTPAKTVDVTNIKVDGAKATADVAFTGALLDGQTLEIALIKDGSQWKLDKANSFTKFDRNKLIAGFGNQVANGAPAAVIACAKQHLQTATDAQLEAIILTPTGGNALFSGC
jgi:hypothetical protein